MEPSLLDEDLTALREALEQVWDPRTAAPGPWGDTASAGQCVPTALIVNDRFGGDILRYDTPAGSHYANRINGREVDLTRDQFTVWAPRGPAEVRSREYLLASAEVTERYELLNSELLELGR